MIMPDFEYNVPKEVKGIAREIALIREEIKYRKMILRMNDVDPEDDEDIAKLELKAKEKEEQFRRSPGLDLNFEKNIEEIE